MAIMKRFRDEKEAEDSVAGTLMLLSSGTGYSNTTYHYSSSSTTTTTTTTSSGGGGSGGRVFECKTCNRRFSSFQALGGHRASHKRAKLTGDHEGGGGGGVDGTASASSNPGPKVHECSICGTEFAMGQALGGHMRRHRAQLMGSAVAADHHHPNLIAAAAKAAGNKTAITKRLYLDLNYPPVDIDGDFLGMGLVGKFPMVHC